MLNNQFLQEHDFDGLEEYYQEISSDFLDPEQATSLENELNKTLYEVPEEFYDYD